MSFPRIPGIAETAEERLFSDVFHARLSLNAQAEAILKAKDASGPTAAKPDYAAYLLAHARYTLALRAWEELEKAPS